MQIKAEHLNFQFSHVTKFITKVIHWMSFIIVLNFEKFCANISFVVNEGSIYLPRCTSQYFPIVWVCYVTCNSVLPDSSRRSCTVTAMYNIYTSHKKKRNTWCRLTHCNLHCRLSFVSIGPLYGHWHLKFVARRWFQTDSILMQTRSLSFAVSPANCGCVHIVLLRNGSGRHACFKHSNCTSTVDSRKSWHHCRDREHKTNLDFLYLVTIIELSPMDQAHCMLGFGTLRWMGHMNDFTNHKARIIIFLSDNEFRVLRNAISDCATEVLREANGEISDAW